MKFNPTDSCVTTVCEICGEHIGNGFDHSECSELKKEMYKDLKVKSEAKKKLSKKSIDYLSKRYGAN